MYENSLKLTQVVDIAKNDLPDQPPEPRRISVGLFFCTLSKPRLRLGPFLCALPVLVFCISQWFVRLPV